MGTSKKLFAFLALPIALSTTLLSLDIRVQIEPDVIEQYSPINYKVTIIGTDEVPVVESTFPESLVAMSQRDYYASRQSSPRGNDSWVQIKWKGYTTESGLLQIPAQKLIFEDTVVYTEAIAINVAPEPTLLKELINFQFQFPKTEAYMGEPLKGDLELRIRKGLRVLLSQPPQIQTEGVTTRLETDIQQVKTEAGWDLDRIYRWPLELRPFRKGANSQSAYLVVRWQEPNPPATGYASNAFSERIIVAPTLQLETEALPANPPEFKGLIGNWSLESSLAQRKLTVQDELVWTIALKGSGAFPPSENLITFSDQSSWRIEGPTVKKTADANILSYLLSPNQPGELFVPRAEVVSFNPDSGTYQTLRTGGEVVFVTQ